MRREIILLRHAHAESQKSGQTDLVRPLSPRGIVEAEAAGLWLREKSVLPARVLCSPALRAEQTLEHALGAVTAVSEPKIYEASAGELIALIATGQSGDFRGVPPAGVAWFEIDGAVEPGAARLEAFWSP